MLVNIQFFCIFIFYLAMYKIYSSVFLLIFSFMTLSGQSLPADSLRIMFVGDIMSHSPQLHAAYNSKTKTYDYSENFRYIKKIFKQADFTVGNLETTLGVKPYTGYPQFSAPPALAKACLEAGINVMGTANNHSCDRRGRGIVRTLDVLDKLKIHHTGTFRNKAEKNKLTPLILEKKNIKIALLNYTYGTNGIPVPKPTKVNLIDTTAIKRDIKKARLQNPDVIIVFLHWGEQYQNHPNRQQKSQVAFLHRMGINVIIGSHPHVIQDVDYEQDYLNHKTYLTVYSLGNFISNQRSFPRDGSMIVNFKITKDHSGKIQLTDFRTIPIWVYKYVKSGRRHYEILPVEDFKSQPDYFLEKADYQKMMKYYKHYKSMFSN